MHPSRIIIIIGLISLAVMAIWMLVRVSWNDTNFKVVNDGLSPNGGQATAEYGKLTSLGMAAAYLIQEKGIKGSISQNDLAHLIVENQSGMFKSGTRFQVEGNGILVERNSGNGFKIYSDGVQIVVVPLPEGASVSVPISNDNDSK